MALRTVTTPMAATTTPGLSSSGQYQQIYADPDVAAQVGAQKYSADAAKQAAMYAPGLQQERFNQVFPWLQGQLSGLGSQLATAGGASGKSPEITVGGVYNPQQIQQRVNSTRAQNDQAGQSQMRQQTQQVGGMGFGANSPLLAALHGQTQANTLATNAQGESDFRNQAAQANAGQVLNTQTAREKQFASRQNEDIERRKPIWNTYNSLIGSLTGLV